MYYQKITLPSADFQGEDVLDPHVCKNKANPKIQQNGNTLRTYNTCRLQIYIAPRSTLAPRRKPRRRYNFETKYLREWGKSVVLYKTGFWQNPMNESERCKLGKPKFTNESLEYWCMWKAQKGLLTRQDVPSPNPARSWTNPNRAVHVPWPIANLLNEGISIE